MIVKTGIGQDSHRFSNKQDSDCILGGVAISQAPSLEGNSDADVVLHSITNSISSITGRNVLGKVSDEMCQEGITDSSEYVKEALKDLAPWQITHVAISIECLNPKISPIIDKMKESISDILDISTNDIGITATTGEGLTQFGKGKGIQALTIMTVMKNKGE